jgi:ribosome-associated protein
MTVDPGASTSTSTKDLVINPQLVVPARDLSWSASRASGPGGQNVNKVATKVTLRFDLRGTDSLTQAQKARLRKLAGRRLDAQGALMISAQAERSQRQNLERARDGLRKLVRKALVAPKLRIGTKPSRASKRRRLESKRRRGEQKKARGKVRQIDG